MDEGFSFTLGFFIGGIFVVAVATLYNLTHPEVDPMKEAFDRGHAVQCLGKEDYHWECDK